MDIFFHGAAGALLASSLGERRRGWLVAAGVIGMLPDLVFGVSRLVGHKLPYQLTHSPIWNGVLLALILAVNWRIAFALPLHLLVDAPLHKYSGLYDWLHLPGINWYQGYGYIAWAVLWAVLIALGMLHIRYLRRKGRVAVSAVEVRGRQSSIADRQF